MLNLNSLGKSNRVWIILPLLFYVMLTNFVNAQTNHVVTVSNNTEYVQLQNYGGFMTNGNPYTVECLFKLNNLPNVNSWQAVFGSGDFFNPNFVTCAKPIVMVNRDATVGTYIAFIPTERKNNNFGQLPILAIPYELQTNTWYHVAFVYNGGNEFYFYVNGRRVGHATKTHFNISCSPFFNNMNVGGLDVLGNNYFNLDGSVDEFRVWRKAKTEIEIQAEMYTHLTGNEALLDVYFDFDDAATSGFNPTNVTDVTGNGNNGVAAAFTSANWSASTNFSCFTGAVNNDFSLPANWYNHQANPSNIGINASTAIASDISLGNLSIGSTGSLTVTNNSTVTLDTYLHAQGTMILEENASLVQLDETVVNQYPITTERTGNTNEYRYSYWSFPSKNNVNFTYGTPPSTAPYTAVPTITETLLTPNDVFNFGTATGQRDPYWLFILTGTQGGYGNGGDNIFWSQIDQTLGLEPGFGFTLKGPLGSNPSQGKASIYGVPNNGDISVPLVYVDNNSYLVGNPYPSAISADEFITRNTATITGTLYFWEQWNGDSHIYDEYIGGYATYTKLGGVTTQNLAQSFNDPATTGTLVPSDYISSGQGFVVETRTNASGNIVFDNDMRVGGNNTQFYRQSQNTTSNERKRCWINFYNQDGDFDQILVGTDPAATFGNDYGLDGKHFDFKDVYAYTMVEDEKYTINALQTLSRPIPLGVATDKNSEHTIALWHEEGLSTHKILLKDKVTRVTHNLKEAPYTFSLQTGDIKTRFELIIRPGGNREANTNEISLITTPALDVQLRLQDNGIAIVADQAMNTIQVSDLSGRVVYTDIKSNFIKKKFEQGFYFITLIDSDGNRMQKKIFLQ